MEEPRNNEVGNKEAGPPEVQSSTRVGGLTQNARTRLAILSDIHYAGPIERTRGNDYEYRDIPNPAVRFLVKVHRRYVWLRDPLDKNYLLDRFLEQSGCFDHVIALGDYSCDSKCTGLSDDAAFESARECLAKLRAKFGGRLRACMGDHELGKFSLVGRRGGLRLASWRRAREELGIEPFWKLELGCDVLIGVTSSLLALATLRQEMLENERAAWESLREAHVAEIRAAFTNLRRSQRVWLFCHDPTALPFLWQEEAVRARVDQLEVTIVGHLHSRLILRLGRVLAGMPVIPFLGHSVRRLSGALHEARFWRPFKVRVCPSLAGIELLKDGGYYTVEVAPLEADPRFEWHRIRR